MELERFITSKLKRSAMFEPSPKLHGTVTMAEVDAMDEEQAWRRVIDMRWPKTGGRPICPKCGSVRHSINRPRQTFHCHDCDHHYSALSGTTFHGFKGGYIGFLRRFAYEGPINKAGIMSAKTALDMRRRKTANDGRNG